MIVDADGWPLAGATLAAGPITIVAERRLDDTLNNAISPIRNVHADRRPELYGASPNSPAARRRLTRP